MNELDAQAQKYNEILDLKNIEVVALNQENAKLRAEYAKFYEDAQNNTGALRKKLEVANLQVRELQQILAAALESGEIDVHDENPACPEDDTCVCTWAKKVSAAMRGYDEVGLLQVPAPLTVDNVLGAGYGEVCQKCGLLVRITCRC